MAQFKFTNDHECVHIEGDVAWVGISKYAQNALGDLVFVELPAVGKKVKKKETFAVVESVKTAAEVYSPVDGEVIAINDNMPDHLDMISAPVNDKGWIAKIKISDPSQLEALMDEGAYRAYLESIA